MRGRRILASVAALAALLVSFVTGAAAAPLPSAPALFAHATQAYDELALLGQGTSPLGLPRHSALSELRFTNHDGYTISVVGIDQTVALSVSRRHRHGRHPVRSSATTYLAHGKVTSTSIEASFADRGRIEVHFRPTGPVVRAGERAGCRKSSNGVLGRPGVFVGELSFRGEGGYTSADVHRVHGGSINFRALIACLQGARRRGLISRPHSLSWLHAPAIIAHLDDSGVVPPGVATHPRRGPKPTTLLADRKLPLARTVFGVQRRGKGRTRFLGLDESSAGSIGIIRIVTASGPWSAFSFDQHLSHAEVAPPAPFSGDGVFQHGPGSEKSWTGTLAVSFLGAPRTPLTGTPFRTQLVQGW